MTLVVESMSVGYGKLEALRDVSLRVEAGECVAVVGPNGAGKSTLLKTIAGLLTPWSGTVSLDGRSIARRSAHEIARAGVAFVPEGRHLFNEMTVLENLDLARRTGAMRPGAMAVAEILDIFPALERRATAPAGRLSGGEQQMLAVGRALLLNAELIMLDEPSVGLAPRVLAEVMDVVGGLIGPAVGLLIVEQNVREVSRIASTAYVLERGRIERSGPAAEILGASDLRRAYLGIGADDAR